MKNGKFKDTCVLAICIGHIGGTVAVIKDYVERNFQMSWKELGKSYGRGFAIGAILGTGGGLLRRKSKENENPGE